MLFLNYFLLAEFTPLSQVRPRIYTYTICVRISRVWEFHGKNDDDAIKHLDLVVIDQKVYLPSFQHIQYLFSDSYNLTVYHNLNQ